MGVCSIAGGTTDRVDMVQDARVTDQLKVFHDGEKRTIRILLVGAGECGKSTIIKQMKILHKGGFTDEEKIEQMRIIRANTVHAMQQLITGCNELQFAFDEKEQEWTKEVEAIQETDKLTEGQILAIENLWKESKAIKRAVERRSDFYLYDSFRYFLDRIRISYQEDYVPSNQCMLKSRTATSGIKETNFIIEEVPFVMYDVGGQRGERKKWIHCFDGVRSIMFVCSLAEYDLVLAEDRNKNRMEESRTNNESNLALTLTVTPALAPILIITLILTLILGSSVKLFEGILSLVWFRHTPIILFMNKMDIFKEKIKTNELGAVWGDYHGGFDEKMALNYIKARYLECNRVEDRQIYTHATTAINTANIEYVWNDSKKIILCDNLEVLTSTLTLTLESAPNLDDPDPTLTLILEHRLDNITGALGYTRAWRSRERRSESRSDLRDDVTSKKKVPGTHKMILHALLACGERALSTSV